MAESGRFEIRIDDVQVHPRDGSLEISGEVSLPAGSELTAVDFFWNNIYKTSTRSPTFRALRLAHRDPHRHDFVRVVAHIKDAQGRLREKTRVWFEGAGDGAAAALMPTFDGPGGKPPEATDGWDTLRDLIWPAAVLGTALWAGGEVKGRVDPRPAGCCPELVERLDRLDFDIRLVQLADELPGDGTAGLEVIDFEAGVSPTPAEHGDVVGSVAGVPAAQSGLISVMGLNRARSGNSARIHDSSRRGTSDPDLDTPKIDCEAQAVDDPFANCERLGNVLIVSAIDPRDGDSKDPAASLTFDFTGLGTTVTVYSIDFLDTDAELPVVRLLDVDGRPVGRRQHVVPTTGDSGFVRWNLGPTSGVSRIDIRLGGSGAIDNVVYRRDPRPR